ncbi:MAG: DUF11 domain-containing protein, partial [Desulfobacterales bacterium]|nr:DUF11 domain-containing protein [Desulfobacterales bacterium]
NGPATATGVTVQDILPSGLSYVSSNGAYVPATGIWTIGNISAGGNASIQITALVTNISTAITNFAQVETSSPTDPDSTPGNDTNNTPNEDDEDEVTIQPGTPNEADLEMSKSASPSQVSVGDLVTYTITVTNNGPAAASGVTVKDQLPGGLSFVAANGSYNSGTGIWTIGNMANGQSKTLTLTALVTNISGSITNFAQVQTSSPSDPDSTPGNDTNNTPDEDDEDDTTIDPILEADLELEKTANVSSAVVGDLVTYTLTVSNNGPATATGVTVQDILPSGLSYV